MFKYELKRNICSIKNYLTYVFCLFPVCISFIFTYIDKMQLKRDISEQAIDINLEYAQQLYKETNAFSYILNFFASADFYMIFILVLLLLFGMNYGKREFELRNSGNGNMLFTRIEICKGNAKIIAAQIIAANVMIITFFVAITVFMLLLSPITPCEIFNLNIPVETNSVGVCLGLEFEYILKLCIFVSGSIILNYVISYFIDNKYVSTVFLAAVYIVPIFVCTIISGISTKIGVAVSYIVPDRYLFSVYTRYATKEFSVANEIGFLLLYILIIWSVSKLYCKGVKKNYL